MALWATYHACSFDEAIERCVNLLGDCDSTASIAGQIAGAIHGMSKISLRFLENLQKWDDGNTVVRYYILSLYVNPTIQTGAFTHS